MVALADNTVRGACANTYTDAMPGQYSDAMPCTHTCCCSRHVHVLDTLCRNLSAHIACSHSLSLALSRTGCRDVKVCHTEKGAFCDNIYTFCCKAAGLVCDTTDNYCE